MALLDDDFVPGKIAHVGNVVHAGLEVFGHHAGVADDHGRGCTTRHQSGIAGGGVTQFRDELTSCDLEIVDQNEVLVASPDQLHDLRRHHRPSDDGDSAIDVDERCYSKLGVDVAGRTEARSDGYDGAAVDGGHGRLGFLAKDPRSAQLSRSEQAAAGGPERG